jgi:RNA polymerase sigma-54 factor
VPGVNRTALEGLLTGSEGAGFLQVLNLLSGGAVTNFSVLANGVYPYITAQIILQLLTGVIPALERIQKEPGGQEKLNQYTYFLAIPMGLLQAVGQINIMQMPDRDKRIVAYLIDNLDDDGFMTQDLAELAALLPPELEIGAEDLTIALKYLQSLDPPGVGARSLGESLSLQLEALPEDTPYRKEALQIVTQHLDTFAARDYFRLKKLLRCDDDALRSIQSLIIGLNPRPAGSFSDGETRYIIPDVVVRKIKGLWVASLNPEAMPKLRINRMYADILHRNRDASFQQLAGQLQEAKWLIKNVQQRFDTILRVSQAIVDRQRHFFEHGEVAMRPLVLREIADTLELHESTVSRVTTQKFMLTARGIFELK